MKIVAVSVAAALVLTACSSSKKTASSTTPASSSASKSASASASSSVLLSKKDFVPQANAACADATKALAALPAPAGDADFPGYVLVYEGIEKTYDQYATAIDELISSAVDKAELNANWRDLEKADVAAARPKIDAVIAAAKAQDATKLATAKKDLDAMTDQTAKYVPYLQTYGLKDCVTLDQS